MSEFADVNSTPESVVWADDQNENTRRAWLEEIRVDSEGEVTEIGKIAWRRMLMSGATYHLLNAASFATNGKGLQPSSSKSGEFDDDLSATPTKTYKIASDAYDCYMTRIFNWMNSGSLESKGESESKEKSDEESVASRKNTGPDPTKSLIPWMKKGVALEVRSYKTGLRRQGNVLQVDALVSGKDRGKLVGYEPSWQCDEVSLCEDIDALNETLVTVRKRILDLVKRMASNTKMKCKDKIPDFVEQVFLNNKKQKSACETLGMTKFQASRIFTNFKNCPCFRLLLYKYLSCSISVQDLQDKKQQEHAIARAPKTKTESFNKLDADYIRNGKILGYSLQSIANAVRRTRKMSQYPSDDFIKDIDKYGLYTKSELVYDLIVNCGYSKKIALELYLLLYLKKDSEVGRTEFQDLLIDCKIPGPWLEGE